MQEIGSEGESGSFAKKKEIVKQSPGIAGVKVFGRVEEGRRLVKVKVCDVIDLVDSFLTYLLVLDTALRAKVLAQIAKQNKSKAFSCSVRIIHQHHHIMIFIEIFLMFQSSELFVQDLQLLLKS